MFRHHMYIQWESRCYLKLTITIGLLLICIYSFFCVTFYVHNSCCTHICSSSNVCTAMWVDWMWTLYNKVYDRMFFSRFVDSSLLLLLLFLFLFIITLIKFHAIHMQCAIIGKSCAPYAQNRYNSILNTPSSFDRI